MSAAESQRLDVLDRTIRETMTAAPTKYHTDKTLGERRFFNEPRQLGVANAGFIQSLAEGIRRD
jgi:hypothetical protein